MSVFKRNGMWHIHIELKGAKPIRQSTGLKATAYYKAQASELHDKLKAESWRVMRLGEQPRKTWQEAVLMWLKECGDKKSIHSDVSMFRWLDGHFNDRYLDELTRDVVDAVMDVKEKEASAARANRYAALIRAVLNKASDEWTVGKFAWLEKAPKIRMRKETTQRTMWLNATQSEQLMAVLPQHMVDAVSFTLQTGLRESNCSQLEWEQVDMERRVMFVYASRTKSGQAIGLPLNSKAMEILRRRQRTNEQEVYVFEFKGKVMNRFNGTAWRNGLRKAGIKDFRWHDLRHTWASWHVQNGTPLHVLQKLGGWQTSAMVQVYAHLAPEHMAADAERIVPKPGIMRIVT